MDGFDQNVYTVQQLLNKQGANLVEDGLIGANTTAAIKQYQLQNNLLPDGKITTSLINQLTIAPSKDGTNIFSTMIAKIKDTYANSPKTFYIIGGSVVFMFAGIWYIKKNLKK